MPAERLSMRKIKEILRLQAQGWSDRKVSRSVNVARTTVRRIRARAQAAGVAWPLPDQLTESALEALLYPAAPPPPLGPRPLPEWKTVHAELSRKGVTLHLLWLEYKAVHFAS